MLKEKQRRVQLRMRRMQIIEQIDVLSAQFNKTNDWQKREVLKQQIYALGQELSNVRGKSNEL